MYEMKMFQNEDYLINDMKLKKMCTVHYRSFDTFLTQRLNDKIFYAADLESQLFNI